MSLISDLSIEPRYTIKTVCEVTGIQAVTLRAWERRHAILTPHRSENRYRLYSEQDIALLRWIKKRLDEGVAISSAVAELHTMQQRGALPETVPDVLPRQPSQKPTRPLAEYANLLFQALIKHNETEAAHLAEEIQSSFPIPGMLLEVFIPCLVSVGDAWYNGKIRISTEHFASNFIKGRLLNLYQNLPAKRSGASVLVGCAPNEQHELGSLMVAILLRMDGFHVEYLGPDLPLDDLADYARFEKPSLIILTSSLEMSARELGRFQEKLQAARPKTLFGYGGTAFIHNPKLIQRTPGVYLGNNLTEAIQGVHSLLDKK